MMTIKFLSRVVAGPLAIVASLAAVSPAFGAPSPVHQVTLSAAQLTTIEHQFLSHLRGTKAFGTHDNVVLSPTKGVLAESYRGVTYAYVTFGPARGDSLRAQVALQDGNANALFAITNGHIAPRALGVMGWPPCQQRTMARYVPAPVAERFWADACTPVR